MISRTPLAGLLIRQGAVSHLLLANLGPEKLTAILPDDFVGGPIAMLDAASLQPTDRVAPGRLMLDAYAVARLRTG